MTYLLEVAVCWTAFYLFYHAALCRETFHQLNRWYLLTTVGLGLVIPAVEISLPGGMGEAPSTVYLQPITVGVAAMETLVISATAEEKTFDWFWLLKTLYFIGVAMMLTRFVAGLFQIFKLYSASEITPASGYRFIQTRSPHSPFSFFRNLFWSEDFKVSEEDRRNIIRHEEAHIFQRHSYDVIWLELLGVAFWCCPPVYWY
jgi:hypothetical protein